MAEFREESAVRAAPNRRNPALPEKPCPPDKRSAIKGCFRRFRLL
jgi:hypothetical protein